MIRSPHQRRIGFSAWMIAGLFCLEMMAATLVILYSYDAAGRLALVQYGSTIRIHYIYDAMGNLTDYEIEAVSNRNMSCAVTTGSAGSFFTITGTGFPANVYVRISVNQSPLLPLVQTNGEGNFIFVLSTAGIETGFYTITATVLTGPYATLDPGMTHAISASFTILITPSAPLRARDNTVDPLISVPAGIAVEVFKIHLPLIKK